jgi:AcrR family transcriptional regulator
LSSFAAVDAVETPWGRMDELRKRKLRPGPGAPRETVARNQRERLFAAMVASTSTEGYRATSVADLIALAGVSRATFYEHFKSKADCFRAVVEELLQTGLSLIRDNIDQDGDPSDLGQRALHSFLQMVVAEPAAARVSLVEVYSAGPASLAPIDEAFERACELVHEALRRPPARDQTPEQLSRAIVGGLHRVLYSHLHSGEEQALLGNCEQLWKWASGYAPPVGLPKRRGRRRMSAAPSHMTRNRHEQILRGFATAVAASGLAKVTIPQIAADAGISNATFYQHFEGKEDALLAALDLSGAQLTAAALPAARREPDWPRAVRRAVETVCDFLASEPAFARLRVVEVFAAGPQAVALRDRAWDQILEELIPHSLRRGPGINPLAIEASSGAAYSLVYEKVRRDELEALSELPPLLTYITLAQLIGPVEATRVASTGSP